MTAPQGYPKDNQFDILDHMCSGVEGLIFEDDKKTCGEIDLTRVKEADKDLWDHTFETVEDAGSCCYEPPQVASRNDVETKEVASDCAVKRGHNYATNEDATDCAVKRGRTRAPRVQEQQRIRAPRVQEQHLVTAQHKELQSDDDTLDRVFGGVESFVCGEDRPERSRKRFDKMAAAQLLRQKINLKHMNSLMSDGSVDTEAETQESVIYAPVVPTKTKKRRKWRFMFCKSAALDTVETMPKTRTAC